MRINTVRFQSRCPHRLALTRFGADSRITEGLGRAHARDGEVITIRRGDTVYTPPGEWHWQCAAPDNFMSHLAIWEAPESGAESEWGQLVTDEVSDLTR